MWLFLQRMPVQPQKNALYCLYQYLIFLYSIIKKLLISCSESKMSINISKTEIKMFDTLHPTRDNFLNVNEGGYMGS